MGFVQNLLTAAQISAIVVQELIMVAPHRKFAEVETGVTVFVKILLFVVQNLAGVAFLHPIAQEAHHLHQLHQLQHRPLEAEAVGVEKKAMELV